MEKPQFRKAVAEDAAAVKLIFDATWPGTAPYLPPEEQDTFLAGHTEEFWAKEIEDEANYFLIEDREEPRFFVLVQPRDGYALLDRIFLLPTIQGQGWGSHLLAKAEETAAERHPEIRLWVTEDNVGAQRFYERHGWAFTGKQSTLDSLVWLGMSKRI